MKTFLEAWLITFLRDRGERGATLSEIIASTEKAYSKGEVMPPFSAREVERILRLYVKWGIVEKNGDRYIIKLDKLEDTIRDVLERLVEGVVAR